MLGVIIRIALEGQPDLLSAVSIYAKSGQILVGPITAFVFFNAYEYTSLGKGIGLSVSWRSALVIGVACGLAQERVLGALKALVGG